MTKSSIFFGNKFSGLSRERFSEILQNFRSAGYMPSVRSILLQNSKNHLTILHLIFLRSKFEVKFANLGRRDPHHENAKFKTRDAIASNLNLHAVQQLLTS